LVVNVHLDSGGEAVNVIQANISYPLNIFDPQKSKVACVNPFPTGAQQTANATISHTGGPKGLIKLACAVEVSSTNGAPPFTGEADIATISLHVKDNAPSLHNTAMLKFVTRWSPQGSNKYSGVARSSDSSNILGEVTAGDVTIESNTNTYAQADINNDQQVNAQDLSIVVSNFDLSVAKSSNSQADINSDGKVNLVYFSILLYHMQ
jgi:hypothetical protein